MFLLVSQGQRFHCVWWPGSLITERSSGFTCSWSYGNISDPDPQAVIWHGIKNFGNTLTVYMFKNCLLLPSVESQPVFTTLPIKEACVKYSLRQCNLGSDVKDPDLISTCIFAIFPGYKLHMWCWYWFVWLQVGMIYLDYDHFVWISRSWEHYYHRNHSSALNGCSQCCGFSLDGLGLRAPHPPLL